MSDPVTSISALREFLLEIAPHLPPPHEDTLFGIAGRGHYENPTSDLLAYFMKPDAQHGFGCLFLREFFKCMNLPEQDDVFFKGVMIEREAGTEEKNRIDLLIETPDWLLLIENKIHHHLSNDLASYERLAQLRGGHKALHFAVISPYDAPSTPHGWTHITYKDYCAALKNHLPDGEPDGSWSKWQVFAREFILHLETELYETPMTKKQTDFAEQNWSMLNRTKKFLEDYRNHLLTSLGECIRYSLGKPVNGTDAGWSLRFSAEGWNGANVSLLLGKWQSNEGIFLRVDCGPLPEEQERLVFEEFQTKRQSRFWMESNGRWLIWEMHQRYDSIKDAESELIALAGILDRIHSSAIMTDNASGQHR